MGQSRILAEAAALVVLERASAEPAGRDSVSTLVRQACDAANKPDDLAKRSP